METERRTSRVHKEGEEIHEDHLYDVTITMLGNLQLIVIDFIAFSQCFNVMIVGR
jgi:hypothetical protein